MGRNQVNYILRRPKFWPLLQEYIHLKMNVLMDGEGRIFEQGKCTTLTICTLEHV